jgi:hypothetical protein
MRRVGDTRLKALVEQATVDCYDESEQVTGIFTMIEDNLTVPFSTQVVGVEVIVTAVELAEDDRIVAVCERGRHRQRLSVLDLPLPDPAPLGAEWVEAYRAWASGSWS